MILLLLATPVAAQAPAGLYQKGMELASQKRWDEARAAFEAGARAAPGDIRFPLQLAGIAFNLNDFRTARRWLRTALRLQPHNGYANEFLATIYALEENLDAALKYWNRAEKPQISRLEWPSGLKIRTELLDSAFAFPPAGLLMHEDYLLTRARLEQLGIFPRFRFQITPEDQGDRYSVQFNALERNAWGPPGPARYLAPLRGVFFQALMPEYANWNGRAVNVRTLARWDRQKQRFAADLTTPRQRVYFDYRRERWDLTRSFHGQGAAPAGLDLRKAAVGYGLRGIVSHRQAWWAELELNTRAWLGGTPEAGGFVEGAAPVVRAGVDSLLWNVPERRFRLHSIISADTGKVLGAGIEAYLKAQGGLRAEWLPQAAGEDYAVRASLRAGKSAGGLPFDELHMLGVERDSGLWMRGHAGTGRGRKGSAPLGRDYLLASWEMDKVLHRGAFWTITAGPLLDTGQTWDGRGVFGSPIWLTDAGVQGRVKVLSGPEITLSWGRDLRGGRNVFYATLGRGPLLARH